MAKTEQLNLRYEPRHREYVAHVAGTYGWTLNETVIRGIRALDELMKVYLDKADEIGGEEGALLKRILKELGLELLYNRDLQWGESKFDGKPCLFLDDHVICEGPISKNHPAGGLIATRQIGSAVEVSVVERGRLVMVGTYPLGDPALN
jgi:hypothetical protein